MYRIHRIMATPFRSVKPKSALLDHFLIAKSGLHNARHPRLTDRRVSKGIPLDGELQRGSCSKRRWWKVSIRNRWRWVCTYLRGRSVAGTLRPLLVAQLTLLVSTRNYPAHSSGFETQILSPTQTVVLKERKGIDFRAILIPFNLDFWCFTKFICALH